MSEEFTNVTQSLVGADGYRVGAMPYGNAKRPSAYDAGPQELEVRISNRRS
jgi:hypothetical protein